MNKLYSSILVAVVLCTACACAGKTKAPSADPSGTISALTDPGPKGRGRIRAVYVGSLPEVEPPAQKAQAATNASTSKPVLVPARVEARFVDDEVRGNVFIPAHFEFVLVEPAHFQP